MKLFSTFLFALVFAFSVNADVGPRGYSAAIKVDGTVDAATIEKHFINVINNEGASIPAGSVVQLDPSVDDGASVIIDNTASKVPLCVMVAACADNALCSCQTYGLGNVLFDAAGGNAVAGAAFFPATGGAGYVKAGTLGGVEIPVGMFYDAATASGTVEAFIKLR